MGWKPRRIPNTPYGVHSKKGESERVLSGQRQESLHIATAAKPPLASASNPCLPGPLLAPDTCLSASSLSFPGSLSTHCAASPLLPMESLLPDDDHPHHRLRLRPPLPLDMRRASLAPLVPACCLSFPHFSPLPDAVQSPVCPARWQEAIEAAAGPSSRVHCAVKPRQKRSAFDSCSFTSLSPLISASTLH